MYFNTIIFYFGFGDTVCMENLFKMGGKIMKFCIILLIPLIIHVLMFINISFNQFCILNKWVFFFKLQSYLYKLLTTR